MPRKSTRLRPDQHVIVTDLKEADDLLLEMGRLTLRIQQCENAANAQRMQIEESLRAATDPLADKLDEIEKALMVYAATNPQIFGKKKSCKLHHGKLSRRQSTQIIESRDTLDLIKSKLPVEIANQLIKRSETVPKSRLAKMADSVLDKIGVERKVSESFKAEPDLKEIEDLDREY